ncbi:hypothetical protein Slin14017_G129350 [Septoria linicola]|nr:hypothetical protein Slin14017_G129350 [Septoria linicola]
MSDPLGRPNGMSNTTWQSLQTLLQRSSSSHPAGPLMPLLDLKHKINVYYPDPLILQPGEKVLEEEGDYSHLFNPLEPLVEDEMIEAHAGRTALPEFSSIYPAEAVAMGTESLTFQNQAISIVQSIQLMQRFTGRFDILAIRERYYADRQHAVGDSSRPGIDWLLDLDELIHGSSRCAIAHRLRMRATYYRRYSWHDEGYAEALAETKQDLELKYKFPPTRHPEYETVLLARGEMAIVDNHNIPEAYHRCPVCFEDFDETHAAVSVPCGNPRHFARRECLLDQIHYQGTDQARCGPCNVFFFPNKSDRDYLKYGLLEGAYINDSRFAEWENMQRSCSDLDRYLTTSSTVVTDAFGTGKICDRSITINYPDMIAQIWLRMVDLDSTIPEIPRRRAINTPDFRYVARMFMSGIFALTGRTMTNKQLFEYLKAHINQGLIWRCGRVAGPQLLGEERYAQLTHAPVTIPWKVKNDLQIYRDGLEEFVDRSLDRALNFIRLRYCCCGPAPNLTWSSADLQHASFHWHGGRLFWDPRHFKRLSPIRRGHGVNNFYKVYNTVPSPGAIHKPSDWKKKTPWRRSH